MTHAKNIKGHDQAKHDECVEKAWDEFVCFIGVMGLNDTKFKSCKQELKNEWGQGSDKCPKKLSSLKTAALARTWDANPNNKKKG